MRYAVVAAMMMVLLGVGCGRSTPPPSPLSPTSIIAPAPSAYVPITVDVPAAGATVASPFRVSGKGIAFENTIQLRVVDANGVVLAQAFTTAFAPDYSAPGPWEADIPFLLSAPTAPDGFLEAFEQSAKDGRELHRIRVPLKFASSVPSFPRAFPTATLRTNYGYITMELFPEDAPITVRHFLNFARERFYSDTQFHRVIPDFMIQGGDPLTREQPQNYGIHGTGGPAEVFADEINARKLVRGALAMANRGPNTNGSQFFVVTAAATPWLDGKHTVFGRVASGMEIVDRISAVERDPRDHPVDAVIVEEVIVGE